MNLKWKSLDPGRFNRLATIPGADPMWVWADATRYRDHGAAGALDDVPIWCVTEREPGQIRSELLTPSGAAELGPKAELAMPVVPERMPVASAAIDRPPIGRVVKSKRKNVLVGIIDSGCPFAAHMLRNKVGTGTRVLALWDQDEAPAFEDGGFLPAGFEYGRAIRRSGLDAYMQRARLPGGSIDEDLAYGLAGCESLRRLGHGAAVISQLFGAPLYGGSLQPAPGEPPAWDAGDSIPIEDADLVFVDIPRAGVQDSTSAAFARYLIDGMRFILAHAVKGQRVVINVSSGTSRTGHDGLSMVERAISETVSQALQSKIDLFVVLPIGNGNNEQRHAVLQTSDYHLDLFLPPDCETPQYVTLRMPAGAAQVRLKITPPSGATLLIGKGQAKGLFGPQGASAGVIAPPPKDENSASRWLVAFAPTTSRDPTRAIAPGGRWRIELDMPDAMELNQPVQFWISRNQRNPGALTRGRQADFMDWDRLHQPRLWLNPTEDDPAGDPVTNGIRRRGSVTGLATAGNKYERIVVVGSHFVRGAGELPSPYSAARLQGATIGPDLSAPGDSSRMLRGLSVRGNRSGEILRVMGTSFSAPLVARALVNGTAPPVRVRRPGKPPRDLQSKRQAGGVLRVK